MADKKAKPVRVVATGKGVYGSVRRKPGDEFDVAREDHVNPSWMRALEADKPKAEKPKDTPPPPGGGGAGDGADDLV